MAAAPITADDRGHGRGAWPLTTPPGSYARFVGRVGALAVALGVGAAVATGFGLGIAHADPDSPQQSQESPNDTEDSPDTGSSPGTEPGANLPSVQPDSADDDGSKNEDDDPDEPSGTGTTMSFSSSGGVDTSTNDAGQQTDTGSTPDDDETELEPPKPQPKPQPEPKPEPKNDVVEPPKNDTKPDPKPTPPAEQSKQPVKSEQDPATLDEQEPMTLFSAKSLDTNDVQRATVVTTPPPPPTASPVVFANAVANAAATFVSALLTPFVAPGPGTPAEPPMLWAALAWIRNELKRNFFNSTPVAVGDTTSTAEDTPVTIDVLKNDTDAEGDPKYITLVTQPEHGDVVINPDGTLTFTPDTDYSGPVTFSYTVRDGGLNIVEDFFRLITGQGPRTTTAQVTVTVTPVNAEVEQTLETEGTPAGIEVGQLLDGTIRGYVANENGTVTELDYDDETDRWVLGETFDVGEDPGKIIVTAERVYVHSRGEGTVSVIDPLTRRETARVEVGEITDIAVSERRSIDAGILYAIDRAGVLSAYEDRTDAYVLIDSIDLGTPGEVNARAAAAVVTASPRLAMRADGRVYASVGTRVVAVDARRQVLSRGSADSAASAATRQLRVVDSVDVAGEVTALRTSADGRRLLVGLEAQTASGARVDRLAQVRVDQEVMAVSRSLDLSVGGVDAILTSADGNRAYVSGAEGSLTTVNLRDMTVAEQLQTSVGAKAALVPGRDVLMVTDVANSRVTVISDPVDDPITTANDTATVAEDGSIDIDVLANDSIEGAESPVVNVVTGPANGTVTVEGGTLHYTPNENFFGTEVITYNVVDGETSSNVSTVLVTVSPVDDDPTVITLNWDADVDLDSHLTGPAADGNRFHVFYQAMSYDADGQDPVDVRLFNDDLTGQYEEVTHINVSQPGVYHFYVRKYFEGDVAGTGATVTVSDADDPTLAESFTARDVAGNYWSVFTLTVSTTGEVTVTSIDTYGDEVPPLPVAAEL